MCDPNDQILTREDFSPFSSFDEEQKRESSESLSIMHDADGVPLPAPSDEIMDGALEGSSPQQISSEISEASRQRHLVEMDAQFHFNRTLAKFTSGDPNDLNESKTVEARDDCSASVSSGNTYKSPSSVDLNSQSSGSQKSSSRSGGGSVRSGSSNNSCRTFTKECTSNSCHPLTNGNALKMLSWN